MTQSYYDEVKKQIEKEQREKLIRNGIPAFPVQKYEGSWQDGMNLRDYFAAKAMQAMIEAFSYKKDEDTNVVPNMIAEYSFTFADMMMKAREE